MPESDPLPPGWARLAPSASWHRDAGEYYLEAWSTGALHYASVHLETPWGPLGATRLASSPCAAMELAEELLLELAAWRPPQIEEAEES